MEKIQKSSWEETHKNNCFEIKKRIVESGESKIFKGWKNLVPALTEAEFIENLKWVCEDVCANGDGTGRLTREIGLTRNGIVHISRIYDRGLTLMYRDDNKTLWSGDTFSVPCTEEFIKNAEKAKKNFADENGTIKIQFKLSISARDRI